jgi:transmembrane anterior posterior transformation protein 1
LLAAGLMLLNNPPRSGQELDPVSKSKTDPVSVACSSAECLSANLPEDDSTVKCSSETLLEPSEVDVALARSSTAPPSNEHVPLVRTGLSFSQSSTDDDTMSRKSGSRPNQSGDLRGKHGNPDLNILGATSRLEFGEMDVESSVDMQSTSNQTPLPSEAPRPSPTIKSFFNYLMGMDFEVDSGMNEELDDACSIAPKRRGIYNLVQVPTRLERLIWLCICICTDEFLFLFTLLPIRCAAGVVRIMISSIGFVARSLASRFRAASALRSAGTQRVRRDQSRVTAIIDLMHLSILAFTTLVLSFFDISWVYHSIRGQSFIKLYVVFNVMEIFDRLCCSFGVDILDSLGWTTASAVNFFGGGRVPSSSATRAPSDAGVAVLRARAFRGISLLTRVILDYAFTLVYVCIHASLLLAWVVTLNVAINTQNNALLTLLVSNNFVELKGAVFKSYKVQNLFQIACSDAVERFQLTVFLCVMLIYAEGDFRVVVTWFVIFLCEVVVDWIKHAFVTKFNRIPHRAYQQFSMVICRDIVQGNKYSAVRSIGGSGVAKRVGFVSLPLAALSLRMALHGLSRMPAFVSLLIFLIMLTIKVSLSVGLLGHAIRRFKPTAGTDGEALPGVADDDQVWLHSLANVGRYDKS